MNVSKKPVILLVLFAIIAIGLIGFSSAASTVIKVLNISSQNLDVPDPAAEGGSFIEFKADTVIEPTPDVTAPPVVTAPPSSGAPKVILWQVDPATSHAMQGSIFAANIAQAETTNFDGVIFGIGFTDQFHKGIPHSQAQFSAELAPVKGINSSKLTDNFVIVRTLGNGKSLDQIKAVELQNWKNLALAAKDAGLKGVFLDSENYTQVAWPKSVFCPSDSQAACEKKAFDYGKEVMQTIASVWPTAIVMSSLGPNHADDAANNYVIAEATASPTQRLIGSFAFGLGVGSFGTGTTYVDGGELFGNGRAGPHSLNGNAQDFGKGSIAGYNYRKNIVQNNTNLLTAAEKAQWASKVSVGYSATETGNTPGPPSQLETNLQSTLSVVDDYVWVFSFYHWWFGPTPGGKTTATQPWFDAFDRAKAAGLNYNLSN